MSNLWRTLQTDYIDRLQQRQIEEVRDVAVVGATERMALEQRVARLEAENQLLRTAVLRTNAMLQVLGARLVETGVVDGVVIGSEMKAALEALEPPKASRKKAKGPANADPYRT